MDILKNKCTRPPICAKCGKSNHTELECQNLFNCINCTGEHPVYSRECEMWKKNNRNKIHKKCLLPRGQKNRTNTRTTQLCLCNKKMEMRKRKINELRNLIEILGMILKVTIKEHTSTVPDECERHNQNQEKSPKQRKEKIQTKQKTLINEPIPLSNRFSPMDIEDPVETTHIKTHRKTPKINK